MTIGATFTCTSTMGIYGKGHSWTVTKVDDQGRLTAIRSADQFEVVWNPVTLEMLIRKGVLKQVEPTRDQQIAKLRAASPLRAQVPQHDTGELGLFQAANEPRLL